MTTGHVTNKTPLRRLAYKIARKESLLSQTIHSKKNLVWSIRNYAVVLEFGLEVMWYKYACMQKHTSETYQIVMISLSCSDTQSQCK